MNRACLPFVLSLSIGLSACGSARPMAKTGPHYDQDPILVPYPPPPGKVEIVPEPPPEMAGAVWVDGEWTWKGRRWVWQQGSYQEPLPDGYFAPAQIVREADGSLLLYPGTWKKAR